MMKNKVIGFADGKKARAGEIMTNAGLYTVAAGMVVAAFGRALACKHYVWYSGKDDVGKETIEKLYDVFEEAAKK